MTMNQREVSLVYIIIQTKHIAFNLKVITNLVLKVITNLVLKVSRNLVRQIVRNKIVVRISLMIMNEMEIRLANIII